MKKYIWYNDGSVNKRIYKGEKIPENFVEGFIRFNKPKKKDLSRVRNKEWGAKNKERKLLKREFVVARELKINKRLHDIDILVSRNMKANDVFEKVKYDDKLRCFNDGLYNIIIEKSLFWQLETMPSYCDTIFESLKSLYKKDVLLQRRKSYVDYLLSKIKQSIEEFSLVFGKDYLE